MGVILGIDIGGSSTKIVGLAPDLSVIDMLRVKADDPLTSLYGAMGNFLSTHHLQLSDIRHIALTGVGASYVEGDIYGVKTIKVEEFPSVGVGGLALRRKERAVVVSMGTGTSLLWAEKGGEIRGKLNGIGFALLLNMDVDTSQHLVVRDVSLQGSRLALPGSAAQENMPAEFASSWKRWMMSGTSNKTASASSKSACFSRSNGWEESKPACRTSARRLNRRSSHDARYAECHAGSQRRGNDRGDAAGAVGLSSTGGVL